MSTDCGMEKVVTPKRKLIQRSSLFAKVNGEQTNKMKYSLWIVPPQPTFNEISKQIKYLAQLNDSPPFMPHITLLGGIEIKDDGRDDGKSEGSSFSELSLLKELELQLSHLKSGIPCNFIHSKGFVSSYMNETEIVWNQACVGIIQRDGILMEAFQCAKKCFHKGEDNKSNSNPATIDFKPPLGEPHLSFVYTNSAVKGLENLELPNDFIANTIALVKTHPPTVEGVCKWVCVGSISMS